MAVEKITDESFEDTIKNNDKVVVKYFADWCGSCKLMSPKFKRLSKGEQYEGISFIEVNAEESQNARKAAGVTNLPFVAIFKDGEFLDGVATNKEEMIVELINKLN